MKVTFVGLGQEFLAISLLSGVLKEAGHETSLVFNPALFNDRYYLDIPPLANLFDRTDRVVEEAVAEQPDLLAFSVLTPSYQWSLGVARAVKARLDVPVIFGGVHPSAVPEVCIEDPAVDYVCVGEGERAILELCEVLPPSDQRPAQPIHNLWWRDGDRIVRGEPSPFIQRLDELPYYDKELWRGHTPVNHTWLTMASRGCPYRCTFCFNNFFAKIPGKGGGSYLRHRSIDHMMGELVEGKRSFDFRRVDFVDDIFTTDRRWLRDFLTEYTREIDRPFQCLVHPRYIDDEMARWLKDAGCQHVQMGLQSADGEYKRTQLLRMEREDHMERSMRSLADAGLDVKLDHMLGLPGEPVSAQEKALELYRQFPPRRIQTFWLTHLPGVELTKSAVESGDLSPEDYEKVIRGEAGRFHSRSAGLAAESARYRRYQTLFRLLPLLPRRAQLRVGVRHVPRLPGKLNDGVGAVLEVANALKYQDDETFHYVRQYLMTFRRQVPEVARDWLTPQGRQERRARREAPAVPPARRVPRLRDGSSNELLRQLRAPVVRTGPERIPISLRRSD
jgi:radical SAM superfamily enzyme YgiQ (UPF0313 family)